MAEKEGGLERKRLTVLLPTEDIERIKKDAKALGWTPAKYVSWCTKIVSESAEETAKEIPELTRAILTQWSKSQKKQ